MTTKEIVLALRSLPEAYISDGMDWLHNESILFLVAPEQTPMMYKEGLWAECQPEVEGFDNA